MVLKTFSFFSIFCISSINRFSIMGDTTTLIALRKQLEFYFGDSNFRRDTFMRQTAAANEGFLLKSNFISLIL